MRNFPIENDNLTFTTKSKNYNDITKAINQRAGTTSTYSPGQIADAITNLPTPTYQQKSLTPDFSSGNVNVTADSDYDALSQVTIQKDSNLTAENIKKDVTVHGITGSYEGGGGGTNPLKAMIERTTDTIYDDSLEYIGSDVFAYYTTDPDRGTPSLESATFINVIEVGGCAFEGDQDLISINLPNATFIGSGAFNNCKSLITVNIPKVEGTGSGCFFACDSLEVLILPSLQHINYQAFNCWSIATLVLGYESVCTLERESLYGTPFEDDEAEATLYVPQALISAYEADSNWAQILARAGKSIVPIEGSPYENV
jgi:hypothetical protein